MANMVIRWWVLIAAALLALNFLLRVALLIAQHASPTFLQILAVMAGGLLRDVAVVALCSAIPVLVLTLAQPPIFHKKWFRWSAAMAILSCATFVTAMEWFFFDEFSSRFNHIALDYVLFPYEVLTNIWESYNVPLFVLAALLVGGLLALPQLKLPPPTDGAPYTRWSQRFASSSVVLALGVIGWAVLLFVPDGPNTDRRLREVAANGMQSLARAAMTSHLDYDAFYHTGDATTVQTTLIAARETGEARSFPQRRFSPIGNPGLRRPDVVVILEESLGAEFIGSLGGNKKLSAGFDRWAEKGTLLTNLYATGNRTVRGLEGVLCSFPPLPGDSIVKRDRTQGVASLAQVFAQAGYRTEFVYGGAGTFDNLRNFAQATGYANFHDDGILGTGDFPANSFRTAWGVADKHLFDEVLARQRTAAAASERQPLFLTALTVSNHKPFLLPAGHGTDNGWDTRHVVRYSIVGATLFILCLTLLIWGRHAVGTGLAVGISLALLVGFSLYVYQRTKPSGSRAQAVTYALDSLATWLDRAEAEGLLRHTVVLVVGDHGARVYGAEQIPMASYRVPALMLTPETHWHGQRIDRLCSQIDLAPTVLSLAGIDYTAPFFGDDLLRRTSGPGRAFLQHNRDIAVMNDDYLVALGLQKRIDCYQRSGPRGTELILTPNSAASLNALQALGVSTYQVADQEYLEKMYHLP